ncbi:MAG: hypothetical protein AAB780_02180 [Patescibacteria group bacterium]
MRILIVTDIYPPEIGGPAEYAKNLMEVWQKEGHEVRVRIFGRFKILPWGLRHVVFLAYLVPSVGWCDCVFTLGAFSAGVSAVASKLFNKKNIFRTGGDLLWELYVERTGDLVLLRNFYQTRLEKLSSKEKLIFHLMKWALHNLSAIIWSSSWQRDIFMAPYELAGGRHFVVENYYGPRIPAIAPKAKNFVASTRQLKWKNLSMSKTVFDREDVKAVGAVLDMEALPHAEFLKKIGESYAVIIASLGDISPNTILDAIRCGKPFILTCENGLSDRIRDIALFVDPEDPEDIAKKVLWLSVPENYELQRRKVEDFTFTHTWEEIAAEYLAVYSKV